jgi:hypothetical protein
MTTADDDRDPAIRVDGARPEVLRGLLLIAGISVPIEIVASQTPQDRAMAARWAAADHLAAPGSEAYRPKPAWVLMFEALSADPEPSMTAVGRWNSHLSRAEGSQRRASLNESMTLELARGAVMAQQIVIYRMRERFAAALATATAYGQTAEPRLLQRGLIQMVRDILGSDEAYAEFTRRFDRDGHWHEETP